MLSSNSANLYGTPTPPCLMVELPLGVEDFHACVQTMEIRERIVCGIVRGTIIFIEERQPGNITIDVLQWIEKPTHGGGAKYRSLLSG